MSELKYFAAIFLLSQIAFTSSSFNLVKHSTIAAAHDKAVQQASQPEKHTEELADSTVLNTFHEEGIDGTYSYQHQHNISEDAVDESTLLEHAAAPRNPTIWDVQRGWEQNNSRTLYFEPVFGLGNRLRALDITNGTNGAASAVVLAKQYGVGLKVIWRTEERCGEHCDVDIYTATDPGFNSTWHDLFAEPELRLASNFPGSTYSPYEELTLLRAENRNDSMDPIGDHQCGIYYPANHEDMIRALETGWKWVNGEEILCVRSYSWLLQNGESESRSFFRLLKPSPLVERMIDAFKSEADWTQYHMVGVHVRRGDHKVYYQHGGHAHVKDLLPIERFIDTMEKLMQLDEGDSQIRFFLATDDPEAEQQIKAAFDPGIVWTYAKQNLSRLEVQGIQDAVVDLMLLAGCSALLGTRYSTYSVTAKLIGWPFYIEVGRNIV